MPAFPLSNSAVYVIRNKYTGTRYFGSSKSVRKRLREHRRDLTTGTHTNHHMQAAWNKYGPDVFEFMVVEVTASRSAATAREQWFMDHVVDKYNICFLAHAPARRGFKMSAAAIEKSSSKRRGVRPTAEAATNQRAGYTPEVRERISASKRGKKLATAHKQAFVDGLAKARDNRPDGYFEKWRKKMDEWWGSLTEADKAWLCANRGLQRRVNRTGKFATIVRCSSKEDAEQLASQLATGSRVVTVRPLIKKPRQ